MSKEFNTDESFNNELEREYKNSLHHFSDAELIEIFPQAVPYLKRKLGYFKKQFKQLSTSSLKDLANLYANDFPKGDNISRWFGEEMVRVWKGDELEELKNNIRRLSFLLKPEEKANQRITPDMIDRAKAVPFDSLIKFNRSGFALCPFHAEKTGSLHLNKRKNFCHCFGCLWSGDTIKFIKDSSNLSFVEAVEKLI